MNIKVNSTEVFTDALGPRKRYYVEVWIDGVCFKTECTGPDVARDLVIRTSRALGLK